MISDLEWCFITYYNCCLENVRFVKIFCTLNSLLSLAYNKRKKISQDRSCDFLILVINAEGAFAPSINAKWTAQLLLTRLNDSTKPQKSFSNLSGLCPVETLHFWDVKSHRRNSPVSKMKVIQLYDFRWKNDRNYQVWVLDIAEKRRKKTWRTERLKDVNNKVIQPISEAEPRPHPAHLPI